MEILKKVKRVLNRSFKPSIMDLEDDDGIFGVVVSEHFRQMESLDRQMMIQKVLRSSTAGLSTAELRRVLAISPMTPEEYVAFGPEKSPRNNTG